jgi:hypothetical protein
VFRRRELVGQVREGQARVLGEAAEREPAALVGGDAEQPGGGVA